MSGRLDRVASDSKFAGKRHPGERRTGSLTGDASGSSVGVDSGPETENDAAGPLFDVGDGDGNGNGNGDGNGNGNGNGNGEG